MCVLPAITIYSGFSRSELSIMIPKYCLPAATAKSTKPVAVEVEAEVVLTGRVVLDDDEGRMVVEEDGRH